MSIDKAISMEPVKEKLRSLRNHIPNQDDLFYEFGEFLAGRLNPELVPEGFALAIELALHDLDKGVDGYTGQPIRSRLAGYPPVMYKLLRMQFLKSTEAVCPEDFAKAVKDFYEQISAKS